MLMTAGAGLMLATVLIAALAVVAFGIQAVADLVTDRLEARRRAANKAARRAHYRRLAGLSR